MAGIIGHSGSCTAGGTAVGTAKIWSLDLTNDTVDTTTFASGGWKENTQTLKGWSGTITVIFDGAGDAGEAGLVDNVFDTTGAVVAVEFITSATGSGDAEKFSGNAIVTSMPVTNDVNGVIEVSFAFVGTGTLTKAAIV